ncbi:CH25H hydroxylase, partial [Polyodon spathula]|nr:CH25H hydroxylase [Polyodon spathula]
MHFMFHMRIHRVSWLFVKIHRVHHEVQDPFALAAQYSSHWEVLFLQGFAISSTALLGCHPLSKAGGASPECPYQRVVQPGSIIIRSQGFRSHRPGLIGRIWDAMPLLNGNLKTQPQDSGAGPEESSSAPLAQESDSSAGRVDGVMGLMFLSPDTSVSAGA